MSNTQTYSLADILRPLAITVIIDTKVRETEMNEFVLQAEGLLQLLLPETTMTRESIYAWFVDNEPELRETINGPKRNTFILRCLSLFKQDDMAVEAMYDAMLHISISDKEYHYQESELVKSAASLWGYTRPPFKVSGRS